MCRPFGVHFLELPEHLDGVLDSLTKNDLILIAVTSCQSVGVDSALLAVVGPSLGDGLQKPRLTLTISLC